MPRTPTHYEQVSLETIQAIIRADQQRRIASELAEASSEQEDSKPRIPGRD
jgi:hypothetical protein